MTAAAADPPAAAYAVPIAARPRRTWAQAAHGLLFLAVFLFGCAMVNGAQFAVLLPLKLVPSRRARKLYYEGVRYTKGAFGALLGVCDRALLCSSLAKERRRWGGRDGEGGGLGGHGEREGC